FQAPLLAEAEDADVEVEHAVLVVAPQHDVVDLLDLEGHGHPVPPLPRSGTGRKVTQCRRSVVSKNTSSTRSQSWHSSRATRGRARRGRRPPRLRGPPPRGAGDAGAGPPAAGAGARPSR